MNKLKHLSIIATSTALLAYGTVAPTQAAQLGTADLNPGGGIGAPNAIRGNVKLTLSIEDNPNVSSPIIQPRINLSSIPITTADIGRTFTVTLQQEPNFNNFASLLTDGRRSTVLLSVSFLIENDLPAGFGIGLNETSFTGSGVGAVDFFGNTIDSLDLRLNSLDTFQSVQRASQTLIPTTFSNISVGTTLTINGQPVPEPDSSIGILASTILGIAYMLKRKRGDSSPVK